MVDYGVTPTGFVPKPLTVILKDIEDYQIANIDPAWDVGSETLMGQINGSVALEISVAWEAIQAVANQLNPDDAEGVNLDVTMALTGSKRDAGRKGTAKLTIVTDQDFVIIPVGSIVSQTGNDNNRWLLVNGGVDLNAGVQGTYVDVEFEAENVGPIHAGSGTLEQIVTPVTGWATVTNPSDASKGAFADSDTDARARRETEIRALGESTEPALVGDLLKLDDRILKVSIITNDSDVIVDGMPPHSFEAIIYDGPTAVVDNDVIAQAIWNGKSAGIQTVGSTSGIALDKSGNTKVVRFSRPQIVPVYLSYDLTVDPDISPSDQADQVKAAAVAYGDQTIRPGVTMYALKFRNQALAIEGVIDVPELRLGIAVTPVGTSNLVPTQRQIFSLDVSRIDVNNV
jgi:hypothetical protein